MHQDSHTNPVRIACRNAFVQLTLIVVITSWICILLFGFSVLRLIFVAVFIENSIVIDEKKCAFQRGIQSQNENKKKTKVDIVLSDEKKTKKIIDKSSQLEPNFAGAFSYSRNEKWYFTMKTKVFRCQDGIEKFGDEWTKGTNTWLGSICVNCAHDPLFASSKRFWCHFKWTIHPKLISKFHRFVFPLKIKQTQGLFQLSDLENNKELYAFL